MKRIWFKFKIWLSCQWFLLKSWFRKPPKLAADQVEVITEPWRRFDGYFEYNVRDSEGKTIILILQIGAFHKGDIIKIR